MIIATVVFGNEVYDRMARVLEYSVAQHCPSATFLRIDAPPHEHIKGIPTHCPANAHKKTYWADVVQEHDEEIVLIDCDTALFGDISVAFEQDFDLAYTVRDHRVRMNAGVMFIRPTPATRRFFDKWMYTQQMLLSEEQRPHLVARLQKYAGLDQAAFMHTLPTVDFPFKSLELPCEIYNSVDQTWHLFDEHTLILHVKGRLRRAVMERRPPEKCGTFGAALAAYQSLEVLSTQKEVQHGTTH